MSDRRSDLSIIMALASTAFTGAEITYRPRPILLSEPFDSLRAIRRQLRDRPTRPKPKRASIRGYTKNTHRRDRAGVARRRAANVRRLQCARASHLHNRENGHG